VLDWTSRMFLVCAVGLIVLVAVMPAVALWGLIIAALMVFVWRIRRWRDLDRRGRLFVVGGNIAAVAALVLAIGGLSRKPGDETRNTNTFSAAPDEAAPPESSPQSTTMPATPRFRYTVTDLGTFGGDTSRANGINNHGQVVGEARTSDGTKHPFLWDSVHGMQDLGGLGGVYYVGSDRAGSVGSANAINDAGQVVGSGYTRDTMPEQHAFLWEAGRGMQDLGTLGGNESKASGINGKGQVVGFSRSGRGTNPHAFLWDRHGGMQDLGTLGGESQDNSEAHGINDIGQVVGGGYVSGHAWLWESGHGMRDLGTLGGATSGAYRVNNSGQVMGIADTRDGSHAFLWDAGTGMHDLGSLRPTDKWVWAESINNAGVVVGNSGADMLDVVPAAFIYEHGKMRSLNVDSASCRGFNPAAINDRGQIAGAGTTPAGQCHAFLLTPVP
jgi:probable HAF family extracellular repeat protein